MFSFADPVLQRLTGIEPDHPDLFTAGHVFRAAWSDACKAAGVPYVRPEWLRHTGASIAYAATRDMKAVAQRLGHTSTRMMDTVYVEIYPSASRATDELVRASRAAR